MIRLRLLSLLIIAVPAEMGWAQEPPAAPPVSPSPAPPKAGTPVPEKTQMAPIPSAPAPKGKAPVCGKREPSAQPGGSAPKAEPPTRNEPRTPAKEAMAPEQNPPQSAAEELPAVAKNFYLALLARNTDLLTSLCKPPFFFEGKAAYTPEEVRKRWAGSLSNEPLETVRLHDVEVLTPEEMVQKYGKAPERLAAWPLRGNMITVGNLSGHPAVVLWKKTGSGWAALGFHD